MKISISNEWFNTIIKNTLPIDTHNNYSIVIHEVKYFIHSKGSSLATLLPCESPKRERVCVCMCNFPPPPAAVVAIDIPMLWQCLVEDSTKAQTIFAKKKSRKIQISKPKCIYPVIHYLVTYITFLAWVLFWPVYIVVGSLRAINLGPIIGAD